MAKLTKLVNKLFPDEPTATNNHDLQTEPPVLATCAILPKLPGSLRLVPHLYERIAKVVTMVVPGDGQRSPCVRERVPFGIFCGVRETGRGRRSEDGAGAFAHPRLIDLPKEARYPTADRPRNDLWRPAALPGLGLPVTLLFVIRERRGEDSQDSRGARRC